MLVGRSVLSILSGFLAFWLFMTGVQAQSTTTQAGSLKSEVFFGSDMGAGQTVSQEAWEEFVSQVVVPRFPAGLTVVEALGRGSRTAGELTRTRILIVVHPNEGDADTRLREIKAEYKKRFGSAGVFHIDHAVRIRDQ